MSSFLIQVPKGHAIILSLLVVLTGLALSTTTPCRAENLLSTFQLDSNIQLAAPLPSEIKVDEVKIQNTLRLSYITINDEDASIQENISQGKLEWQTENLTVQSANIIDNMNHSMIPLYNNGLVMNPSIEVTMEPYTMYNLSLIVVLMPGASYVDSLQAWDFATTLRSEVPVQATITLPSNFSTPFYAAGAEFTKNQNYKVLTWQSNPQQTPNETIEVVFLPFPYNPQTIFLNISSDISSVFPIWGGATASVTQEFTSLSEYNGLVVPPIFEIPVPFPPTSDNNTQVTSVYDSEGPCAKLPERLSEVNYTNSGKYYPDHVNQVVYVYPRATSTENLYDYFVTVTFDLGKPLPFNGTGPLMPYDSIARDTFNLKPSGDWEVNLTQESIVEFWLPKGTQPHQNSSYIINYDSSQGRYSVTFVNSTSEWTTGTWEINFYIVRLYDFFWTGIFSIAFLLSVVAAITILRKRPFGNIARGTISYILPSITGFVPIGAELAIANDWIWAILTQKIVLTAVLVAQVVLTIVVIVLAQKWRFENNELKQNSEAPANHEKTELFE